jgi:UDP-N-acetylmuramoylalanine--D-glutamate ligase
MEGKAVMIIGAKRSGLAAAALLRARGANVRLMDELPGTVDVVIQSEQNLFASRPDLVVVSPGVPYDLPMLQAARVRGVPVIGEVELASYYLKGPIIGITGSNGKTTTTALTGHVLKECGIACLVGGNIGTAVTSLVESSRDDQWNVLELSSFQLETIFEFRAQIGACLNVTPDHLDRHHTFENYTAAKGRLFETQTAADFAVLNEDDPVCCSYASKTEAQVYWFSLREQVPRGVWLKGDELCWANEPFMDRSEIRLRGLHNVENAACAATIAHLAGARLADIGAAMYSFPGVEHRIEFVRSLDGVDYFNDSKATNVDATLKAIAAFPRGLWIILGGKDKGSDYFPLAEALGHCAKAALLIGAPPPYPHAAAPLIRKALSDVVPVHDCGTLAKAVTFAREHAASGDTVLLAPACASFDQFENYEERGRVFKQLVQGLF